MSAEWAYLRGGLLAVATLVVAALAGWGIYGLVHDDPGFALVTKCLTNEKGAALEQPRDPVALSAELGAVRTIIETNGVTISVAADNESAARIARAYEAVAGELGERLEVRGRLVYLWDRPASPTQRQTVYDCTY